MPQDKPPTDFKSYIDPKSLTADGNNAYSACTEAYRKLAGKADKLDDEDKEFLKLVTPDRGFTLIELLRFSQMGRNRKYKELVGTELTKRLREVGMGKKLRNLLTPPIKPKQLPQEAPLSKDDITVVISEVDGVGGIIHNGKEGVIKYYSRGLMTQNNPSGVVDVVRFHGSFNRIVLIDGKNLGIEYELGKKIHHDEVTETVSRMSRRQHLNTLEEKRLTEILEGWMQNEWDRLEGKIDTYTTSPISIINDTITVTYEKVHDVRQILSTLQKFQSMASHPESFTKTFMWSLFSPLGYELKLRATTIIKVPNRIKTGWTGASKTSEDGIFLGKGYDQRLSEWLISYQRVKSDFKLLDEMRKNNLPKCIDEIPRDFVERNRESLKEYAQTGHFGSRGRPNLTSLEYPGMSLFDMTSNGHREEDADRALNARLIPDYFTEMNERRKNIPAYNELMAILPTGFMYSLHRDIFGGKNITDILKDIEQFGDDPMEYVLYVLKRVNHRCKDLGIEPFPVPRNDYYKNTHLSYAQKIAQGFTAEWERLKDINYKSDLRGEFSLRENHKDNRIEIWFTSTAFDKLSKRIKVPFDSTTEFLGNVTNRPEDVLVLNEGQPKNVRHTSGSSSVPLKSYGISVAMLTADIIPEEETPTVDFDTGQPDPDVRSFIRKQLEAEFALDWMQTLTEVETARIIYEVVTHYDKSRKNAEDLIEEVRLEIIAERERKQDKKDDKPSASQAGDLK